MDGISAELTFHRRLFWGQAGGIVQKEELICFENDQAFSGKARYDTS